MFQYHEPQSSSASELVTELIYYQPNKVLVSEEAANFLLSGICLDTKFYRSGTSGKTFEMSMILKNYQASVEAVTDFFKEEYEEMKLISGIVNTSKSIYPGIYIAKSDDDDIITRTVLSKAAEEILATKGVQAVFVIGRTSNNEDFNIWIKKVNNGDESKEPKSAKERTIEFAKNHPLISIEIGTVNSAFTNISSNSQRFADNSGLKESGSEGSGPKNAFRHVLWRATITKRFGIDIAREVGFAHEENPDALGDRYSIEHLIKTVLKNER